MWHMHRGWDVIVQQSPSWCGTCIEAGMSSFNQPTWSAVTGLVERFEVNVSHGARRRQPFPCFTTKKIAFSPSRLHRDIAPVTCTCAQAALRPIARIGLRLRAQPVQRLRQSPWLLPHLEGRILPLEADTRSSLHAVRRPQRTLRHENGLQEIGKSP